MKKFSILFCALFAMTACQEEEVPLYDATQEQSINFWAPPVPGYIMAYPDDLEKYTYTAYAPGSVELGFGVFATEMEDAEFNVGVEIMGVAAGEDRKVKFAIADSLSEELMTDERLVVKMGNYVLPAGEGTAEFPVAVDMSGLDAGETGSVVLVFDGEETEFLAGLGTRNHFKATFTKRAGTPMATTMAGFGLDPFGLGDFGWDLLGYSSIYGAYSLSKLQFCAAALMTNNLSAALPTSGSTTAIVASLKAALEEYKALSETDPVNYPPMYQTGTTWISFP